MAGVFAKVGKAEADSSWFWSGGHVSKGVKALTGAGGIMVDLAKAVQDFANLTVSRWEYVETKDGGELKEVERRAMTESDFSSATFNMRRIVSTVMDIFKAVGKAEDEGGWFFSNNYVSKGIKALAGAGETISQIADGVQKMANMQFITYGVKGDKIVPVGVTTVTPSKVIMAGINMKLIIGTLMSGLRYAGQFYEKYQEQIDTGKEKASSIMQAIGNYGKALSKWQESNFDIEPLTQSLMTGLRSIADGMFPLILSFKFYSEQWDQLVDRSNEWKKSIMTYVFGMTFFSGSSEAVDYTNSMLGTTMKNIAEVFVNFGNAILNFPEHFTSVYVHAPLIKNAMVTLTKGFKFWMKAGVTDEVTGVFRRWHEELHKIFNPQINPSIPEQSLYFTKFTSNVVKLVAQAKVWQTIAEGMNKTADGMERYSTAINNTDPRNLEMMDSLMASLAVLGKDNGLESLGAEIGEGIEAGLEKFAEKIAELIGQGGGAGGGTTLDLNPFDGDGIGIERKPATSPSPKPSPQQGAGQPVSASAIANALKSALRSTTITVKSGNVTGDKVSF